MRISIKIKLSMFLTALLFLVVLLLSLFVLRGIKANQQDQYESYLARQGKTANTYFFQTLLMEANKSPGTFLENKGQDFAEKLELIIGLPVVLYNESGEIISKKPVLSNNESISETLKHALDKKTAYLTKDSSSYYMTPLLMGDDQVGVVQYNYSLTEYQVFYESIRHMFVVIGTAVFVLGLLLGNIYYNSFANNIISLDKTVDRIKDGHYDTSGMRSSDEIGRLSLGIHHMSQKIKETIHGMEEEQKKLRLAVDKLSRLDSQQKQFIGNVTHEFKTPLTSIKAYLDLLEMYPEDDGLLETSIINIKSETDRLYDMVEKVLQLSALDKYDFELNMEKLELNQELERILNSLRGKLDKFSIRLITELTEGYIKADKDSLTIILINLLDNAIKYNKANGMIAVKTYETGDEVHIEISDTGIGIPKDLVDKVFEPFYMVDKNRSREVGGAGLGLSLIKKNTELMGGRVKLLYSGEEGTSFRVTFPSVQERLK